MTHTLTWFRAVRDHQPQRIYEYFGDTLCLSPKGKDVGDEWMIRPVVLELFKMDGAIAMRASLGVPGQNFARYDVDFETEEDMVAFKLKWL